MLVATELSKRFGGFLAINRVSFEVREGEIVGLIGPNGSGKSTTFNLIAGTLRPTGGSIRFCGEDITGLPAHKVCHRGIARTFQIPRPFRKLSLIENVMLAAHYGEAGRIDREEARRRAEEALDLVGLTSGGATTAGLGAAALKKLELARALATRPKLLLADESLGGLDAAEMERAADLLARIRSRMGITIVWVEHLMATLMRVISGLVAAFAGAITLDGRSIVGVPAHRIVEHGIAHVPENRRLFPRLTVEDNLRIGAFIPSARHHFAEQLAWVYQLFPQLRERRHQPAGTLSGGEQQMCAIGRALMSRPRLLLMDEPSAGLAPLVVQQVFDLIRRIRAEGLTVLIVEQNVQQVLEVVDRAYLLEVGNIRLSGTSTELKNNEFIRKAYMGL